MIHATKIRLILDFGIQLLLFILLAIQLIFHPNLSSLLYYGSIFGMLLSLWQIIHAVYVVRKYQDWHRKQYLSNMKQLLAYGLLTLFVGFFMILTSFGFLAPFFYFSMHILHWVVCGVVLFLAIKYFRTSFQRLYQYFYGPKSFWDLK